MENESLVQMIKSLQSLDQGRVNVILWHKEIIVFEVLKLTLQISIFTILHDDNDLSWILTEETLLKLYNVFVIY